MINIIEALQTLINPKKAEGYLTKELPNSGIGALAVNLAIVYALSSIVQFIGMAIGLSLGPLPGAPATLVDILFRVIGGIVFGLIMMVIFCGILHLIAKAFGGRGTFLGLLYLSSVMSLAFLPINLFFTILFQVVARIPFVSCIVALLYLPLVFYLMYLSYLVIKVVYRLDGRKAAYVMVAYLAISFIIGVLLAVGLLLYYWTVFQSSGGAALLAAD